MLFRSEELIRPAVTVPDWAREEADIAPDAKLDCHVDEGSGVITVCETFSDHDLSDIPAELLEALRKSGCCLSVLEDMLMDDEDVYKRQTPDTVCLSSTRRERTVSSLTRRGTTMPGTVPLSPTPAVC